ncbi:MAG: Cof-type HAD-IIB family hydrolase [Propionibacteriaceae bacterium]|jgi:Cof subfamily protein (haloacid dehalogenase superfamily)|nr:Cof-type HAD-IIB family hydrolase [Propionibacteriaceae bacterium]
MIRFVLCDVDGTLAGSITALVTPRVRESIHRTIEAGIGFGFATGRCPLSLHTIVRDLDLDEAWAICSTGSVIARYSKSLPSGVEIVRQDFFNPGEAVHTILNAIPGGLVASWQGDHYLSSEPFPSGELTNEKIVSLDEILKEKSTKVILRWPDMGPDDLLPIILNIELPPGIDSVMWKEEAWLDLMPSGVSKGSAAIELASILDLNQSEILAIGDDYNDIELLRWAGQGVAMAEAPAPVLDIADEVTGSFDEDGVAMVLDRLIDHRNEVGTNH